MRFTPFSEPSDREIDAQRLPPYCPQCEEPTNNYDELCQDCQDMNPHSTHPSQDQDGKDSAFTASTAELFKPLPTIEEIKAKLKEWIRMADEATPGPWDIQPHTPWDKRFNVGPAIIDNDDVDQNEAARNATFIATSRTAAPLAWKALLETIETLEKILAGFGLKAELPSLREQFQPIFHLENR